MKFKINFFNGEPKPLTPFELYLIRKPVLLFILALLIQIFLYAITNWLLFPQMSYYPFPGVTVAGDQVTQGINLFSGDPVDYTWGRFHTAALISIVVFYFLIPAAFINSFNRWKRTPAGERESTRIRKTLLVYTLTGTIVLTLVLFNGSIFLVGGQTYKNVFKAQNVNSLRDILTSDLTELDYHARTFLFLPRELGGGGGRWKNIPSPDGKLGSYSLPQLNINHDRLLKLEEHLVDKELANNVFILKFGDNDTTITISGVGNVKGNNPEFKNADGRKGFIQVTTTLTPLTHAYVIDQ